METIICWIDSITLENIRNILVSIPGIILGGFSLYFAHQKIGEKIFVSYSIGHSRITENRISELEFINKKNKPISIFSIHAVIDNHVVVDIDKFKIPIILKPLESLHIETPAFSALYLGGERYKAEYGPPYNVDIYIVNDTKKIKCITINHPSISAFFDFEHFINTTKSIKKFNGKVYNENVKFAITYRFDSQEYTALVEDWGFIAEGWNFKYNQIPPEYMSSKDKVKEYLTLVGYDKFFDALHVDDID